MSTPPRVGPHAPPVGAPEPEAGAQPPATKTAIVDRAPADRVTTSTPKAAQAKPQQPITPALARPATPPVTERRARFGGERGAWLAATRRGILLAADTPEIGQELLEAFDRGVA